jgi:hypothetical protein
VKVYSANENDPGKLGECSVDLNRNAAFSDTQKTQRLGIVSIMSDRANTLNYEGVSVTQASLVH